MLDDINYISKSLRDSVIINDNLSFKASIGRGADILVLLNYSGFPSERINLSPFTKDFRGGEQLNESLTICLWLTSVSLIRFIKFVRDINKLIYAIGRN